ncbi:hypothetical protein GCM10009743_56700 [Kribbella swartbergensis]
MRAHRSEVPRWVSTVIAGVVFGVGMGTFMKLDGSSWVAAGVGALVTGIPFGLATGWWSTKWQRSMKEAEGDLPADKVELAHRAAAGGPVPDDEEVRSAALRIASQHLAGYTGKMRRPSIVLMVLLLAGSVVGAITESPWTLLGAVVPVFILYTQWYYPRQLRRRITLLSEATDDTAL